MLSGCYAINGDIRVNSPYADTRIIVENSDIAIVAQGKNAKIKASFQFGGHNIKGIENVYR